MKGRYLEVTFRKGRPVAAYLYLPREPGVASARTERASAGVLIDYAPNGAPIGLEITAPEHVTLDAINEVLSAIGLEAATEQDLRPLAA